MLVTGCWLLGAGRETVQAEQALAPRVALLLFVKSVEYHNFSSLWFISNFSSFNQLT